MVAGEKDGCADQRMVAGPVYSSGRWRKHAERGGGHGGKPNHMRHVQHFAQSNTLTRDQLDRTNIGNAKTGGMQADLNLTASEYSLVLSIFFVGYLLWEVPSNMMLARSRPSIFLPTIMFIWGAMSIGAKGINSLGGMVAFRFVLGLVEAGFFPGVMLLMSCWYKPAELSKRIALFYTASLMAGAFGGLLAGGVISGLEGKGGTRGEYRHEEEGKKIGLPPKQFGDNYPIFSSTVSSYRG